MILSANEARRLSRTRWQAELFVLDHKIRNAILEGQGQLVLDNMLYNSTMEYLENQGYKLTVTDCKVIIEWSETN